MVSSASDVETPSPSIANPTTQEGVAQQTTQLMVALVIATSTAPIPVVARSVVDVPRSQVSLRTRARHQATIAP